MALADLLSRFDDCLKLGRRIEETPYLLPEPEILRSVNDLPPKAAENGFLNGAVDPDPVRMPSSSIPRSPRGPLQVFAKRKVMLGPDLGIGSHLKDVLKALIGESKGQLTNDARNADMFICKYREGSDYRLASQAGKDVGNLAWLYYLITNNSWTSPIRRLLHYPVARNGVPGFQGLRISLSNYSGEARLYLENLVVAAGAECTKTLKQDNTHLITAHIMSEKCAAAKDWGVHIINHLWLEESYAKWKIQSITNSRYTHFPRRTNLGEVVGQTKIDRHALELYFYYAEDARMEEVTQQLHAMQPKVTNMALNSASSLLESPTTPHMRHVPGRSVTCNGATPRVVQGSERMAEPGILRTPAAGRIVNNGKENQTPSTSSSRKSKDAAAARLHDIVSDIALYEKEKKRVGGVIYGGRRKTDAGRVVTDRKRSVEDLDSDATERGDSKRARTGTTSTSMRLLVSGYKKWIGQPKFEDADKVRQHPILVQAKLTASETTEEPWNNSHPRTVSSKSPRSSLHSSHSQIYLSHVIRPDHHIDGIHRQMP
jgi:twin BRCT domain